MPQLFLFENIFEGPVSTVKTGVFKIQIKSADGLKVLETQEMVGDDSTLHDLKAGKLTQAIVKQVIKPDSGAKKFWNISQYKEVGKVASVMFTIQTLNVVPTGGGIQLMFPKMSPGKRESFF
jgi:hypothetical protein